MESEISEGDEQTKVGWNFVHALNALDFECIQACFHSNVRFRALVPSALRQGASPVDVAMWFRTWFGDADELSILNASVAQLAGQTHISYRVRIHEKSTWYLVEQQAYCVVTQGLIGAMSLLCSGFHPEANTLQNAAHIQTQLQSSADTYYDAGARGCADGPLDEIARLMRELLPGQTLNVHATDPSVTRDLPAWCRMVGHTCTSDQANYFLIRHK